MENREIGWGNGELRALHYYSWLLTDEKRSSTVLIVTMLLVCVIVLRTTESVPLTLAAFTLLLIPVWRVLVPIHFEITSDGIARWNFGRRRLISWEEIKSYELLDNGVLLLPNAAHYPLEPFHGLFIPVPASLRTELKYRLRFFIDKTIPDN